MVLNYSRVNFAVSFVGFSIFANTHAIAQEFSDKSKPHVFLSNETAITCDFYASSKLNKTSMVYQTSEFSKHVVRHVDLNTPKVRLPNVNFQKAFTHVKIDHDKFSLNVGLMLLDNGEVTLPWITMSSKKTGSVSSAIGSQVLGKLMYPSMVTPRVMKISQGTYLNDPNSKITYESADAPFLPFTDVIEVDEKISPFPMDERAGKTFGAIVARCLPGKVYDTNNAAQRVSFTYSDLKFLPQVE